MLLTDEFKEVDSIQSLHVVKLLSLSCPLAAAAAKSLQSCPTRCDPHRRQPTRLPRPWDSPGKNTGVGCHFHLQCMKVKTASEVAQSCTTRSDPMDRSLPGSSVHGIFQARALEWVAIAFSQFPYTFTQPQRTAPPKPNGTSGSKERGGTSSEVRWQ